MNTYRSVFLSLLLLGCASKDDGSGGDSGGDLNCSGENGTALFGDHCAGCHGNDGDLGPGGSDDFDDVIKLRSDSDLIGILENGTTGGMMAPNLTPCEEEAVLLYLRATFGEFGGSSG